MSFTQPYTPKFRIFTLISLGVLVLSIGAIIMYGNGSQDIRKRAGSSGVILKFSPATATITSGDSISVGITVSTGTNLITAADVALTWDTTKLQATAITGGPFLTEVLTPAKITDGAATITLGLKKTGDQLEKPKKGAGILATVTFRAIGTGKTVIKFTNATQVAAIGKTIDAVTEKSTSSITVETKKGTTATPTPTKKPNTQPTIPKTATPTPRQQEVVSIVYTNTPVPPAERKTFGDITEHTDSPAVSEKQPEGEQEITDASGVPASETAAESDNSMPETVAGFFSAILQFFRNLFRK
jgi:hypothetical protein